MGFFFHLQGLEHLRAEGAQAAHELDCVDDGFVGGGQVEDFQDCALRSCGSDRELTMCHVCESRRLE